ncbi:drug/metabolite transporter superfamily [Ephemerocybe angulata]|uniref:Drug/metabolite transporter superfamily n=1 Tax=Ephemerocybe angulata TaxID=980116 RepID=A0A8H6I2C8_9AGAR|nr:drug/metabolite transporter superfamily [Tulosesus angulatus]
MDDPNISEQELWPPKKASRIHQAWAAMKTALEGNTGLLLVAASQAFFSLMNVSVKTLNSIDPPVSALQLIFVRMSITWFCCTGYMIAAKVPNPILGPKGVRLLLVFRGFTGFISLFGIYYSLQYLSLSDATVLTFLAPLCTAVAGAVLLGEKFSLKQAAAAVISLIGVVLIARPASLFGGLDEGSPLEVLLPEVDGILTAKHVALIGVLGATGAYTTLTAIGKRAHPLHALTSFSVQSVIATSVAMLVTKQPIVIPARAEWLAMFVMIGIFGFFAQILLTMGLQRESASRGSMAIYTQIVFATIFERVFFNVVPTILSGIGTLLIVASAIYVAVSSD